MDKSAKPLHDEDKTPSITSQVKPEILKCKQCAFICHRPTRLESHLRIHSLAADRYPSRAGQPRRRFPVILLKCDKCDFTCNDESILLRHVLRKHSGDKPYKCGFCHYTFKRKSIMLKHQLSHSNKKPYKCKKCSFAAKCEKTLVKHRQLHVGEILGESHCARTKSSLIKEYRQQKKLKKRIMEVMGNGECATEEVANSQRTTEVFHKEPEVVLLDSDESVLECEELTHTAPWQDNDPENNFIGCEKCNLNFVSLSSLKKHQRTHHRKKRKIRRKHCADRESKRCDQRAIQPELVVPHTIDIPTIFKTET